MKKIIKLIASNLFIVITAVILYSPGLLCLRITDYSIFRAGMSIISLIALVCLFFFINIRFLKEPSNRPILPGEVQSLESVRDILKTFSSSKYLKGMASTAEEQVERIYKCRERLSVILDQKFTKGTMSWDKFNNIVMSAENSAIKNVVSMANRMLLFDEREFLKLQHYREDNIPDDIQEEQLDLYNKNFDEIKSMIALNEKILLKLNTLTMEVSSSTDEQNNNMNDDLINEIEKLISETKYYQ